MGTKIVLDLESCKQCPFFKEERMYTEDSFEEPFDWFCMKMGEIKKCMEINKVLSIM